MMEVIRCQPMLILLKKKNSVFNRNHMKSVTENKDKIAKANWVAGDLPTLVYSIRQFFLSKSWLNHFNIKKEKQRTGLSAYIRRILLGKEFTELWLSLGRDHLNIQHDQLTYQKTSMQ